ncbi:MAG: helix-turn-helix transcriptional regulator, partial [Clostridia bacterium]|nr:helix-turn-helix transcriptional regulator [Clostridia bacterium]
MNLKIGENIRRYRREKSLSQEMLAERLGVSFQAVSKWERNETYPDVTLL